MGKWPQWSLPAGCDPSFLEGRSGHHIPQHTKSACGPSPPAPPSLPLLGSEGTQRRQIPLSLFLGQKYFREGSGRSEASRCSVNEFRQVQKMKAVYWKGLFVLTPNLWLFGLLCLHKGAEVAAGIQPSGQVRVVAKGGKNNNSSSPHFVIDYRDLFRVLYRFASLECGWPPAAPGSSSEMWTLRLHPRPTK